MDLKEELEGLLAANVPLINLITYEELRVIETLKSLDAAKDLGLATWDLADCRFTAIRDGKQPLGDKEFTTDTLLPFIAEKAPDGQVFVLKDFHHSWDQKKAFITRKLRNMAPQLRKKNQFLVMITPDACLPKELKDDVVVLQVPLPDLKELTARFDQLTRNLGRGALPKPAVKDKLVTSALGLTTNQAQLAFSRVWARFRKFDERGIDLVTWAKRDVIRDSGALEFWPAEEGEADVGGLDLMKDYLRGREQTFAPEAVAAKVPPCRGVLLVGIPGTGKSLSAKMLSGLWKWPLLRLDLGAVFGSLLGESEKNLRLATSLADTVSPCIMWIDEVEKAFAGSSTQSLNAGAATRVLGTFLTWMQEHRSPVMVVGTANEIEGLPPELLGRFDRLFFVDLPNDRERREIILIHLNRAEVPFPARTFDLDKLVDETRGFVGREIDRIVREAQFTAFADSNREMEQNDLLKAIEEVVPLSQSHHEVIEQLRRWKTEGRAFPASSEETRAEAGGGRVIETL